MKKRNSYRVSVFVAGAVLLFAACSTTRNTFVTRSYHNVNSKFNGLFYAHESMKDAALKIDQAYVDDYSQLLPVFKLANTNETKGCYPDLEKAIKKATTCIEHHAITTKSGDEIAGAVKWIDDCWLVIGQAHYYKGEYLTAIDVFDYVIQKYSKFPIRYDGLLWKARTEIEMDAYTEAESLLDLMRNDKACPPRLLADMNATYADLYMHTGNYPNAVKYLELALKFSKVKKDRIRYTFILAQLYEKTGDPKKAYSTYAAVIAMHPPYDMLFNAKLNRARLSGSDAKNRAAARKDLTKMLSDTKNTEYRDQIYYALAQLELAENHKADAIHDFSLSVAYSISNNKQKAISYMALGDIYFADADYPNAQAYYDSTLQFLPKDYASYDKIDEKKKSLTNLVKYIKLVATEDSLQKIVSIYGDDTTKLYPFIDDVIRKVQEDEIKKKQQDSLKLVNLKNTQQNITSTNTTQSGTWYFYNQSLIASGISDFNRRWGNRKLEDNWRRSNKETVIADESDTAGTTGDSSGHAKSTTVTGGKGKYSRAYYLKNLPLTPDLLAKSNERIADALYNLGLLYKEQMSNNAKAADAFESLCKRYPDHKYALPSHYQLYRIYTATKDAAKAEEQHKYICTNFPKSEYCELINNPDKVIQGEKKKEEINLYYDSTFAVYSRRDFQTVLARCSYADSVYGNKNDYSGKFAFLRAASLGVLQGSDALEKEMTKVVANYPKDSVRIYAQAILDRIKNIRSGQNPDSLSAPAGPKYSMSENAQYQCMIVVDNGKGDVNKFKNALSDFDGTNFSSSGLTVSSLVLDNTRQCILVRTFTNSKAAMDYYTLLTSKKDVFSDLQAGGYSVVLISNDNFPVFYKDKDMDTYLQFFQDNFLPKK